MLIESARVVFPGPDRAELATAVTDIMGSGTLALGRYTERFERAFAAAHGGGSEAVATSSGTTALEIVLRALGVAGWDVVIPVNAPYPTAAAVIAAGARPVYADIDAGTFGLSPQTLAEALTPDTAAAVLVHTGGMIAPEAEPLGALCRDIGIVLVEDAGYAHGSSRDGRHAGAFGAAAAFSLDQSALVTAGEGGMILTSSPGLADEARIYRDHGRAAPDDDRHVRPGQAGLMSELSAATGLVHLRRLGSFIGRRRAIAARYDAALAADGVLRPVAEPPGGRRNVSRYLAVLPPGTDRDWFTLQMAARQVLLPGDPAGRSLPLEPALDCGPAPDLPVAGDLCRRLVCLPVHSDMRDEEADQVVAAVREVSAPLAALASDDDGHDGGEPEPASLADGDPALSEGRDR